MNTGQAGREAATRSYPHQCVVKVQLPEKPVDLYVNGTLMGSGLTRQFDMITPALEANRFFEYVLSVRETGTKRPLQNLKVTNVRANSTIYVDLRALSILALAPAPAPVE